MLTIEPKPIDLRTKRKLTFDGDANSLKITDNESVQNGRESTENLDFDVQKSDSSFSGDADSHKSKDDMSVNDSSDNDDNQSDDDHDHLTTDEKFLKKTYKFLKKKAMQKVKLISHVNHLKRKLDDQKNEYELQLAAERKENDGLRKRVDDLEKSRLVECLQCHEEKPKLPFDFCSFNCFQGVCSPKKAKKGE